MEIRAANGRELRKIKRIYLEAFPRTERKPFRMMKKKARQGAMERRKERQRAMKRAAEALQFIGAPNAARQM